MSRSNQKTKTVAATELAKLAVCEQQLVFDKQRGRRLNEAQKQALALGQQEHQAHHENVQYYQQLQNRRCFIASILFGVEAPETQCLRTFRDEVLSQSWLGRGFIQFYYRYSPFFASHLQQQQLSKVIIRKTLIIFVAILNRRRKSDRC